MTFVKCCKPVVPPDLVYMKPAGCRRKSEAG